MKLIYIKYRNKRKKKDSQRGGKVKRSKSLVQLRLMSGHKSLDGTQTEKYQEENFTNLAFTFMALIKDSRYFRTN